MLFYFLIRVLAYSSGLALSAVEGVFLIFCGLSNMAKFYCLLYTSQTSDGICISFLPKQWQGALCEVQRVVIMVMVVLLVMLVMMMMVVKWCAMISHGGDWPAHLVLPCNSRPVSQYCSDRRNSGKYFWFTFRIFRNYFTLDIVLALELFSFSSNLDNKNMFGNFWC